MAKFCTNCGAAMDDASAFCTNCGAPIAPVAPQPAQQPQVSFTAPPAAPAARKPRNAIQGLIDKVKKEPKKLIVPGAIALGVIVAAILLIVLLSGGGYKGAIDNLFDAWLGDRDALEASAPEAYWEAIREAQDMSKSEFKDFLKNTSKGLKEIARKDLGKDIEVEFEIEDKEKMDKDDLEDIEDYFKEELNIKLEISKGYELEIKFKMKGDEGKEKDEMEIVALKIDGKWYLATVDRDGKNVSAHFVAESLVNTVY